MSNVPQDHILRQILQPHWIHPELMIRMLIVGYCFAIRSERGGRCLFGYAHSFALFGVPIRRLAARRVARLTTQASIISNRSSANARTPMDQRTVNSTTLP
jgi:hypothetical protein